MAIDFKDALIKGVAYGAATGAAVGAMDDDFGAIGGAVIGGLFGAKDGAGMPAISKLTAKNVENILKTDSKSPQWLKTYVGESQIRSSMTAALNRGAFIGSTSGAAIGMFSDDTSVTTGTIEGALIGAGLGFARNKNWLSMTAAGFTKNSKKTGSNNAAINAVT